jgi:3-hydroxyacyl-CoA dehydrogenase
MTAEYKIIGDVAVITMSNPPINGLGLSTRVGITDGLTKANADPAVKSIIITGAGKAFSGGADIREFGSPKAVQEPNLLSVIRACENSAKPVLAAVHTVAMGGGVELALGCHYRMAAPACKVALPEVKLGLIPGAGATQRLPRVLGVEPALNMIVSGEAINSEMLAMLPGQKLFDRMATRNWLPNMPTDQLSHWCAICHANTLRAMLIFSLLATWSRAWPRTFLRHLSVSMRLKQRPRKNLKMA